MNARIDALLALTKEHALADTRKHYGADQYLASFLEDVPGLPNPPYPEGNMVIGLRRFVVARVEAVEAQLAALGY